MVLHCSAVLPVCLLFTSHLWSLAWLKEEFSVDLKKKKTQKKKKVHNVRQIKGPEKKIHLCMDTTAS